jgi:hypothetical protein
MASRWLKGALASGVPLVLAVALAPVGGASEARAETIITVKAATVLHLKGSDIYCTVLNEGSPGPAVACFHDPGGPTSNVRKGYAVVAFESGVAVEPPNSNKPITSRKEPSLGAYPNVTGGAAHSNVVDLGTGDGALVSGTHMAVAVEPAKGGGLAMGVLYIDSKGNPIRGTFTIGVSNHYVTIVQVENASGGKVIYRHAVY